MRRRGEYWYCQHGQPWGGFCRYCPGGIGTQDRKIRERRRHGLALPLIGNFVAWGVIAWVLVEAF